jgi:hypothetical protein
MRRGAAVGIDGRLGPKERLALVLTRLRIHAGLLLLMLGHASDEGRGPDLRILMLLVLCQVHHLNLT